MVDVEYTVIHSSDKSQSDFLRLTSDKIALTSEKLASTSEKREYHEALGTQRGFVLRSLKTWIRSVKVV